MNTLTLADLEQKGLGANLLRIPFLAANSVVNHLQQLPGNSTIVFYGCGAIAKEVALNFKKEATAHSMTFATSSPPAETTFHGYPLQCIDTFTNNPPEYIFLLSKAFEQDMLNNLTFFPRDHIITLEKALQVGSTPEIYQKATDLILNKLQPTITTIQTLCEQEKPTICFTTLHLSHNFLKIMRALSLHGYSVIVILGNTSINSTIDIQLFQDKGYFDHLYITDFSYTFELSLILQDCPFTLIHAVASMAEHGSLARALSVASCPVIIEYLDFKQIVFENDKQAAEFLGLTKLELIAEQAAQKEVYSRAQGVIIKDSPKIIEHLAHEYKHNPKWLNFNSYISSDLVIPATPNSHENPKKLCSDGGIHIVYAGCLHNNPHWHPTPIFRSTLTAIQQLNEQGIHFSIYNAMDSTGEGFEEYLNLAANNSLFDYNFAVPYDKLPGILAQYDFGWFCFDFSHAVESTFFHRTTMGSKIFSYLEAGIPILISPEQAYMTSVVEDLGVGLPLQFKEIPDLTNRIKNMDRTQIMRNIQKAQDTMTMDKQLPRLVSFYNDIITSYSPKKYPEKTKHA